jgi:hypothetical protein
MVLDLVLVEPFVDQGQDQVQDQDARFETGAQKIFAACEGVLRAGLRAAQGGHGLQALFGAGSLVEALVEFRLFGRDEERIDDAQAFVDVGILGAA